jgi:hypothetical protein
MRDGGRVLKKATSSARRMLRGRRGQVKPPHEDDRASPESQVIHRGDAEHAQNRACHPLSRTRSLSADSAPRR